VPRRPTLSRGDYAAQIGHSQDGASAVSACESLFPGGVDNTRKDPARFESLYSGVVAKIFGRLPDTTWVYPGHGADTTLGAERPHLEEWRARAGKEDANASGYESGILLGRTSAHSRGRRPAPSLCCLVKGAVCGTVSRERQGCRAADVSAYSWG
jgi:hypothetical protein